MLLEIDKRATIQGRIQCVRTSRITFQTVIPRNVRISGCWAAVRTIRATLVYRIPKAALELCDRLAAAIKTVFHVSGETAAWSFRSLERSRRL